VRDPVNRHTLAIALIVTPVVFGSFALNALGTDAATLGWVLGAVTILAGVGGWLHPPVRSLRVRGALSGVVIATGALAATYAYVAWRGGDRKVRFGHELVLPTAVGGLPGMALYYALIRAHKTQGDNHSVTSQRRTDGSKRDEAAQQGDEADER
jgi:hypothetical protein